jgi:hypothetical protein
MTLPFKTITAVDFEFSQVNGNPKPLCVVAHEIMSGRRTKVWLNANNLGDCPYGTGPDDLFIAYYASAEIGCHLALGWPVPARIIDLCVEFKLQTSGLEMPNGRNLLAALLHYGLTGSVSVTEKSDMRELALSDGPFTDDQRTQLLDYCESDVTAVARLWHAMAQGIDTPRALLRGRYMAALSGVERNGVPVDVFAFEKIRRALPSLKSQLIAAIDEQYGVYEGDSFSLQRFETYLNTKQIPWPKTPLGRIELKDDTFKNQSKMYPNLRPLHELRSTVSNLKLFELAIWEDGRNRTILGAFGSKTGRNQPSNKKFIFGPATWVRSLIKPEPGMALAYIDYEQQEFAIAASLSGDSAMMEAYMTGDPYLAFARMAGAVPADATKASHGAERERFKVCALAVQYGMGAETLAAQLGLQPIFGRELLAQHKRTFPRFWQWIDQVQVTARVNGKLRSALGWELQITGTTKPNTVSNWPCQANGSEMLRLAVIAAVENGIRVCAPVHDALLIEAPEDEIDAAVCLTRRLMGQASRVVLSGFEVRTDVKIVRHPNRWVDPRGVFMWEKICSLIPDLSQNGTPTCP